MCPKCGSARFIVDGPNGADHRNVQWLVVCLDCWHRPEDWSKGHLQPVTTRIEYECKGK
jgi:hypothetical protein